VSPQLLNEHAAHSKTVRCDDPALLAAWSQHGPYAYETPLTPKDRDFPQARQRLSDKGLL